MSNDTFVQEHAYAHAHTQEDELEMVKGEKIIMQFGEFEEWITDGGAEECVRGIVVIDILGE